ELSATEPVTGTAGPFTIEFAVGDAIVTTGNVRSDCSVTRASPRLPAASIAVTTTVICPSVATGTASTENEPWAMVALIPDAVAVTGEASAIVPVTVTLGALVYSP